MRTATCTWGTSRGTFERIAAATEPQSAWERGGVVARNLRLLPGRVAAIEGSAAAAG